MKEISIENFELLSRKLSTNYKNVESKVSLVSSKHRLEVLQENGISIGKLLGRGNFGGVWSGILDGRDVAIKFVEEGGFLKEIALLRY
jgi:hypothetical protein